MRTATGCRDSASWRSMTPRRGSSARSGRSPMSPTNAARNSRRTARAWRSATGGSRSASRTTPPSSAPAAIGRSPTSACSDEVARAVHLRIPGPMRTAMTSMKTLAMIALTTGTIAAPASIASAQTSALATCDGYSGMPEGHAPPGNARSGMVWIGGGSFIMGSDEHHPEERAPHEVTVQGFWIDRHEVTNAQFARFVLDPGYRTLAERGLDPEEHPGMPPQLLVPGSMVFFMPERLADMADVRQWWRYVAGADWRHPTGPGSSIEGKDDHPVVHVAYEDALAYARSQGSGRRRARHHHLGRHRHADPADRHHRRDRPRGGDRRSDLPVPDGAGLGGAGRDAVVHRGEERHLSRRRRDSHAAQHLVV